MKKFACLAVFALLFASCTKVGIGDRYLVIKFKFNDTLARMNDAGIVIGDSIGASNAAVTPKYNSISANFLALFPNDSSKFSDAIPIYTAAIKDSIAFAFNKYMVVKEGETFLEIPLTAIKPGSYKWLGAGLAYSNVDVPFKIEYVFNNNTYNSSYTGTVATLLSGPSYINEIQIKDKNIIRNGNEPQGFWAFESRFGFGGFLDSIFTKNDYVAPNATTVVNPLFGNTILPNFKSYGITTGKIFGNKSYKNGDVKEEQTPLVITGLETESIILELNLSTRNSFIWEDGNQNKMWEPFKGERIVDMGLRGMKPLIK